MSERKEHRGNQVKQWERPSKGGGKKTCRIEGCQHPYRAKGYCHLHYQQWRKGKLPKSRYTPCQAEKCTARPFQEGLCEKHFNEKHGQENAA